MRINKLRILVFLRKRKLWFWFRKKLFSSTCWRLTCRLFVGDGFPGVSSLVLVAGDLPSDFICVAGGLPSISSFVLLEACLASPHLCCWRLARRHLICVAGGLAGVTLFVLLEACLASPYVDSLLGVICVFGGFPCVTLFVLLAAALASPHLHNWLLLSNVSTPAAKIAILKKPRNAVNATISICRRWNFCALARRFFIFFYWLKEHYS